MRTKFFLLLLLAGTASASTIDGLVVFGDSLSDDGNAAFVYQNFPALFPAGYLPPLPPNYTAGRYTNGTDVTPTTAYHGVWVEQLAAKLGVADPAPALPHELVSALPNGSDFAIAGALTGTTGAADMGNQVGAFLSQNPTGVDPNALYILFGGANDLFVAANPSAAAATAIGNIGAEIAALYSAGARNFLFPNLPDLGRTPRGLATNSAALSSASLLYDQIWTAFIAQERAGGINVTGVDLFSLFQQAETSPAAFGLMNVNTPAQGTNANPDQYLFWDIQHPTTAGHALLAGAAFTALSTPEPTSALLSAAGLAGFGFLLRRKRAAARA